MATTPRLSSRDAKETEAIEQTARLRTINPDEKPVEVAAEPELKVEIEGEEAPKVEEPARVPDRVEVQPEPVHQKVEAPREAPDEGVETLKKQIEELKAHRQAESQRAQAALLEAQRRAQEAEQYRVAALNSQYDSVVNTLSAAQTEAETATQQYAIAMAAQDYSAASEAHRRLARAEAQIAKLEDGKRAYEDERNRPQPQLQQQPQLLPQEEAWLSMHPEVRSNRVLGERLDAAYHTALARGYQRGTQAYFDHIEQELGYRTKPEQGRGQPVIEPGHSQIDPALVSAPVSRETQSMATGEPARRTSFRLTREQAEIAKASGLTPQEYAKQLIKLEEMKKSDPERYYGRS